MITQVDLLLYFPFLFSLFGLVMVGVGLGNALVLPGPADRRNAVLFALAGLAVVLAGVGGYMFITDFSEQHAFAR